MATFAGGENAPQTIDYQAVATTLLYKFIDVVQAVIIIVVGMMLVKLVRRYLQKIQVTHETQRVALNLLEKLTSGVLIVMTFTLALKVIGLDLTLIISALTLGLSFGLKDIIKNYISGILILFKSPFKIGDIVKIRSFVGKVAKIEFQATTLKTFDRKEVTIYNKDILSQSIVNFSVDFERRIEIRLLLGHGTDLQRCFKVIDAILGDCPQVLPLPKRTIVFRKFSELGVELAVRFWVKRPCNILKIRTDLAAQLHTAFDEANILAPFSRSVEFGQDVSMTEGRKERLRLFYARPELAAIAVATNGAVQVAVPDSTLPAGASEFADEDEPEEM